MSSDFSRRYAIPGFYPGCERFEEIRALAEGLACNVFKAKYADVRPPTGQTALLACLVGLCRPGDTVLLMKPANGGQPARLLQWAGMKLAYLPFDEQAFNVATARAVEKIHELRPRLVVLGTSLFPFPPPTKDIAAACQVTGSHLCYDGSHVMGLIAGGVFPNPLAEGAEVLLGSTHKTLAGPQGGLILSNSARAFRAVTNPVRHPPFFVSNFHPAHVAALAMALTDTLEFGTAFAKAIVANAQAIAEELRALDLPVIPHHSPATRSHQVLIRFGDFESPTAFAFQRRLEEVNILVDATIRVGTQEVTRLGMTPPDMRHIAGLIGDAWFGRRPAARVAADVLELASQHQEVMFTHAAGGQAYSWIQASLIT